MPRLTKKQQRETIPKRARELAATGNFSGWLAIEHHLRFDEGMPLARQVLDHDFTRKHLDQLCENARRSKSRENASR